MKLAAIYNVWDGVELLQCSMECLKNDVDVFIIVWQQTSNFLEEYDPMPEMDFLKDYNHIAIKFTPYRYESGSSNETKKRNLGIQKAIEIGCTHFIQMDCDEYYEDFGAAKQLFLQSFAEGSVCKLFTYFKEPTLRLQKEDNYWVPFIHELNKDTTTGARNYPFYVDPTRRINERQVVELPIRMHHFSYVRRDIERKIRNSSANINILKSQLLADYHNPALKEGYYLKDYSQQLIRVENLFNINILKKEK